MAEEHAQALVVDEEAIWLIKQVPRDLLTARVWLEVELDAPAQLSAGGVEDVDAIVERLADEHERAGRRRAGQQPVLAPLALAPARVPGLRHLGGRVRVLRETRAETERDDRDARAPRAD